MVNLEEVKMDRESRMEIRTTYVLWCCFDLRI